MDDVHIRSGLRDILELEDYQVVDAFDSQDALNQLETMSEKPGLILSNNTMPNLSGAELLRELRSGKYPDVEQIPFALLTAKGYRNLKEILPEEAILSDDRILIKPFDARDIVEFAKSVIG